MGDLEMREHRDENRVSFLERDSMAKAVEIIEEMLVVHTEDGCMHWIFSNLVRAQRWRAGDVWKVRIFDIGGSLPILNFKTEEQAAETVVTICKYARSKQIAALELD